MRWHNSSYKYRKKITIDYTKVIGDETDYPMLYSVTDNDLKDKTNGGGMESSSGFDTIFYTNDGVQMYHELELYTNTTGNLVIWIRIPSISSTSNTIIYLYYGNASITTDQSSTSTWTANFRMVQHMDDLTTSTIDDSTSYGNNGAKGAANQPIESTSGKIGECQNYTKGHYIDVTETPSIDVVTGTVTVSMWIRRDATATTQVLLDKNSATPEPIYVNIDSGNHIYQQIFKDGSNYWYNSSTSHLTSTAVWYYIVCVFNYADWSESFIYLNGSLETANGETQVGVEATCTNNGDLSIGATNSAAANGFDGTYDECVFYAGTLSANWINTTWNNQNAPTTFSITGGKESLNAFISGLVSLNTTLESNKLINSLDSGVIGNNLLSCRTINQVQ